MSKTLYNPTNETLSFQWGGEWTKIPPDQEVEMDDARANQGLSELARRGLVSFSYKEGLDRELRRSRIEEGLEANKAFKRKQIMDFNSLNDQRKQQKLQYLTPQKSLKDYAKELGMALYEPYSASDEAKREGMELRETIREKDKRLREQTESIAAMQAQIADLTAMMGKIMQYGAVQVAEATGAAPAATEKKQADLSAFEMTPAVETKSKRK
jgi:hypothetical protein